MSKYIRTESGIIYVGDLIKDEYGNYCDPKNYETDMEVGAEYIIKEADTIEELIMPNDMLFVGEDKVQMPIFVESIEYLKAWLFCHDIYKIKEFYIKVDNDWHLVAKTNDKGGLELI